MSLKNKLSTLTYRAHAAHQRPTCLSSSTYQTSQVDWNGSGYYIDTQQSFKHRLELDNSAGVGDVNIIPTSRVPVEGKSSVCLIRMKYRIIFVIIIIISLGQILLSYIANTSRTHACTKAHACTPPHTPPSPHRYSMGLCQPTVTARFAGDNNWSLAIEINTGTGPRF